MAHPKPPAAALMATPDDIEQQFYEAMQQGQIDKLMSVWADDDEIVCVHPGGPRVVGAAAIRSTFEAIFANGAIPVQPQSVHRLQAMGAAVHHLAECIRVNTQEGEQTAWVMATNVYVKTAQGWRLVAHHASPAAKDEATVTSTAPSTLH